MLSEKAILITGGTGSFGRAFVRTVLAKYPDVRRLVIYSRDELKQFEMSQELSPHEHKALRYFIGDVRDQDREALWRRIALVPQKAFLFSGTVASNLRYGDAAATDEALWHALTSKTMTEP